MLIFLITACIILYIIKFFKDRNLKIKLNTFWKRGLLVDNGPWGVYCYVGKQGSRARHIVL